MELGDEALLLDTHMFLWLVTGMPGTASRRSWQLIKAAAQRNALAVSEITFWEIAAKSRKKRLHLDPDTNTWLADAAKLPGIGVIQLDRSVLIESALLEIPNRDPADRMLVATALRYDLRLATADADVIEDARSVRRLRVLDARA